MAGDRSTVTKSVPGNLADDDHPFITGGLVKSTPTPRVAEYENVKISSEGILFQQDLIMSESFAREENFRRFKRKRTFKRYEQSVKLRPTRTIESAVWVTDDWSKGYFHWLADVLPKLVIGAARLRSSPLLLPARFRDSDLAKSSLEMLGIRNIEFVEPHEAVVVRRLYLPIHTAESGDFDASVIREVRRIFRRAAPEDGSPARRVYISRACAKRRKIVNENEVSDVLRDHGFETVIAEGLTFEQQVRLFSSARHLVSIHGAGLSNMLFMPEGSRVMEFRKNDPRSAECFSNMSAAFGHKFYIQPCRATDEDQAPYSADLIVDSQLLEKNLEQFLLERTRPSST